MFFFQVCYFNVHKRCQRNVANNCGINARQLADILNDMGMKPHKLTGESKKPNKKVSVNSKQLQQKLSLMASDLVEYPGHMNSSKCSGGIVGKIIHWNFSLEKSTIYFIIRVCVASIYSTKLRFSCNYDTFIDFGTFSNQFSREYRLREKICYYNIST